jgi:hypothetical protein
MKPPILFALKEITMKSRIVLSCFFFIVGFISQAGEQIGNMITETDRDCLMISSSTAESEDVFYESECKAFGGYTLKVVGKEDRVGPALSYRGFDITLKDPDFPHKLASKNIEWFFSRSYYPNGAGTVDWFGMVYQFEVQTPKGKVLQYYGLHLLKGQSCVVGISESRDVVVRAVYDGGSKCLHY